MTARPVATRSTGSRPRSCSQGARVTPPAAATALTPGTTSQTTVDGVTFTTAFASATAVTTAPVQPSAVLGVGAFTVAAPSLVAAFQQQQFLGFYRDAAWTGSLGTPIWDFGGENSLFAAQTATLGAPVRSTTRLTASSRVARWPPRSPR